MNAKELTGKIFEKYGTREASEIAAKSGVKVVFQRWFPATYGEFDWKTKTICVNDNAAIGREKIIAHELGHFFRREFNIENIADEEKFCDEFADELIK